MVSHRIHFRPEAESDIEKAAVWYEKQREGLGNDFLDELLIACDTILENPNLYPLVHRQIRRAVIQRFPFGIYYQLEEGFILIVAVMHGSRHPKRWQKRT